MTKPIGEENYAYRQWESTDMNKAVSESSTTTLNRTALAKKYHVPRSTLNDRIERGDKEAVVGHPKFFKKKEQDCIANYTVDSKEIGLPRRKRHLKGDIQHVIIKKRRINCSFKDNKPGKNWFKNMKKEFNEEFPVYEDDSNDPVFTDESNLKGWCDKKRRHILNFNQSEMLDSRGRVFVVELDKYSFDRTDKIKNVRMVICYTADGFVLNPLFINSGYFHQNTMRRHIGRITFLWSPKNEVDRDIVLFIVMDIQNHMKEEGASGPVVLWLTPELYDSYSLLSWMTAHKAGIVIQFFPQHLYQSYCLMNRGVFDKLFPALDKEIQKRLHANDFTSSFHSFCDLFWDIWATIGLRSHLCKSCQGYKLCHLRRRRRGETMDKINEESTAAAEAVKMRYQMVTHPFALPPFTHLRLQKYSSAIQNRNGKLSGNSSVQQNVAPPPRNESDMAPFDTGLHAHRNVPGVAPPINPCLPQNVTRVVSHTSQRSLSENGATTSTQDNDIQTVFVQESDVARHGHTSGSNGQIDSAINSQSDNNDRFQYAYGPNGLHVCPVQNSPQINTAALIKVERPHPRYRHKPKRNRSKSNVKVKSEDSTDSD